MLAELGRFIRVNFQRPNNGLIQLILIHTLVFFILIISRAFCVLFGYEIYYQRIYQYLILPANWNAFLEQPWSIFTYFWIHEQFLSIIWNSLFLYAFGRLILSIWNSKVLQFIYVLGGIVGAILFLLLYNLAPGLQEYKGVLVGPSGCLYAVMIAAAIALPNLYFNLLFLGGIKIKYIAAVLLLLACFELANHQPTAIAHLGGALSGYIYVLGVQKITYGRSFISFFLNIIRRKRKFKITYGQSSKNVSVQAPGPAQQERQADIDAILDKIAASGYKSLSQQEKEQLFHAGK
jgi:membrane associated rhomboid family serine protease